MYLLTLQWPLSVTCVRHGVWGDKLPIAGKGVKACGAELILIVRVCGVGRLGGVLFRACLLVLRLLMMQ